MEAGDRLFCVKVHRGKVIFGEGVFLARTLKGNILVHMDKGHGRVFGQDQVIPLHRMDAEMAFNSWINGKN